MRNNFLLFFVLVGLLIFTYYNEELGQYYQELQRNEQSTLLKGNIERIQEVRFKDYTILLDTSQRIKGHQLPVSQKKIDQFLSRLSYLKIQRKIDLAELSSDERKAIEGGFNHRLSFLFTDKEIIYELGAKIQFAKTFYMRFQEKNKEGQLLLSKVLICFDSAPRFQAYDPQNERDAGPYLKVRSLFSQEESSFYDFYLFEKFPLFTWAQVDNVRNRHFDILMEKFQTNPKIYKGIEYRGEEFEEFYQRLKSLKADRLFVHKDTLSKKVSTIRWKGIIDGELSLWRRYGQREGYFVAHQKIIYELSPLSSSFFFYNVQDFWLKRPFGKGAGDNIALSFKLKRGQREESFHIPVSQEFKVESLNPKVRPDVASFQKLFLLIFGGNPKQQAQRVQKITPQIKDMFSRQTPLSMEILGHKLHFLSLKDEVLIWDQPTDLVFYYLVGPYFKQPFALTAFLEYSK